jgi:hypothetical protein
MKHFKLPGLLAIIISLVACKKDKLLLPLWSISITDSNNTYNFTGNSYKQVSNSDRAYFNAFSNLAYSNSGVPLAFFASSSFDTYNGNAKQMSLNVILLNGKQPSLANMNPANSFDVRFAAMQQWLLTNKFELNTTCR